MSSNNSIHLPNLLAHCESFELRTNRWCRFVSTNSTNWLCGESDEVTKMALTVNECVALPSMKFGLLSSLCLPTLDAPQLRLLTDFLSLLFLSNSRVHVSRINGNRKHDNPWKSDIILLLDIRNGLEILKEHTLFECLVPKIERLVPRAPANWLLEFTRSVRSYYSAQLRLSELLLTEFLLEEYLDLYKDASGLNMMFDLIELVEGMKFSDLNETETEIILHLKEITNGIIAYSLEICYYIAYQADKCGDDLVSVLKSKKGLSSQEALDSVGSLIHEAFNKFHTLEESIIRPNIPLQTAPPSPGTPKRNPAWIYKVYPLSLWDVSECIVDQPPVVRDERATAELTLYVRSLKDCIIGTINWLYETEMFFGKKGREVKAFGWVFLDSTIPNQSS